MKVIWAVFIAGLSAFGLVAGAHAAEDNSSFKCGAYTIQVVPVSKGEYTGVRVKFLNRNGRLLVPEVSSGGEVMALCRQHAILLLDTNTQYAPSASSLYSEDGAVLLRKKFGEIAKHGKSDDDKIFWIETFDAKNKKPTTQLQIYSYIGKKLAEASFSQATTYSLIFQRRQYAIQVIEPDFPG